MGTSNNQDKYQELEQIRRHLMEQGDKLRAQLKQVETRAAAVALAIEVWKSEGTKAEADPYLKTLKGLTQVQALTKIARDNGTNRFRLTDAKKLLFEAGLVKNAKNAGNILFNAIQRSEKFKRVAPGEYELIQKPVAATLTFHSDNLKRIQS